MKKLSHFLLALAAVGAWPTAGAQPLKGVQLPVVAGSGSSALHYELRVDDAILGEHTSGYDGVNHRDANGVISGPDHRSRNHTVSAWVRRGASDTGRIMGLTMADRYQLTSLASHYMNLNGDIRLKAAVWNSAGGLDACAPSTETRTNVRLAQGQWAFVTTVIDDDNLKATFYVDGVCVGEQSLVLDAANKDTYSKHEGDESHYGIGLFGVDCNFTFGHSDLDIAVGEVQVWNRALTPYEVRRSAVIDNVVARDGLVGLYRLDASAVSFDNLAEGGPDVKAVLVQGNTMTSGVKYYQSVAKSETMPATVEGCTLTDKTLTLGTPQSGGTFKVVDAVTGAEVGAAIPQYTPLRVVATPEAGFGPRRITVKVGGKVEYADPVTGDFVLYDDAEVNVEFGREYAVRAVAGAGGKISVEVDGAKPADSTTDQFATWLEGSHDITFRVEPNEGFAIASFAVNSESAKDKLVDNAHTVNWTGGTLIAEATFRTRGVSVTVNTTGSGSLTAKADGQEIEFKRGVGSAFIDSKIELTPVAADGYELWSIAVNGVDVTGRLVDGTFTLDGTDDNIVVDLVFKKSMLDIAYRLVDGGELLLSVDGAQPVVLGSKGAQAPLRSAVTLEARPVNADSKLATLMVNGEDVTSAMVDGRLVISPLTDDLNVAATFDVKRYNVVVDVVEGADLGEVMIVNKRYDSTLNTLAESIASGTDIDIIVYFNDQNGVVTSAVDTTANLTPEYGEDDGYKMAALHPATILTDRRIELKLGDAAALGATELAPLAATRIGSTVVFSQHVDLEVYSTAGVEVARSGGVDTIDLGSRLAPGFYIVIARAADGSSLALKVEL